MAVPFAFRVYATYEVDSALSDKKLHSILDKLNPELRSTEEVDGKRGGSGYPCKQSGLSGKKTTTQLATVVWSICLCDFRSKFRIKKDLCCSISEFLSITDKKRFVLQD